MPALQFFGWWRPPGAAAVSSGNLTAGRLTARLTLTARDLDRPSDTASRNITYDLFGPGDATGLGRGAVVHTYPSPGAANVEVEKAVYAELGAPDLPWRHTVVLPQGKALRPWIVLLVGTPDEIEVAGTTVRLQPSVLDAHPLAASARGAHVEDDGSRRISRLISSRALLRDRDHVAVIVPGFTAAGTPAWPTPATGPIELPVYHHWAFHTRAGGDFAVIAGRLQLREAGPQLGAADVSYGPIATADLMSVRGALSSLSAPVAVPPPPDVRADVAALTAPLGDAAHPVLGLPDHAEPWPTETPVPPGPGWRSELRTDYRARAVAGIGSAAGIVHQELLAREAGKVAGAYEEAADRLRRLAFGLLTSRSLWKRRIPQDPVRRLGVLGPALRDVRAPEGPVAQVMEHPDRALERGLFSSAAQRALRRRADTGLETDGGDASADAVPAVDEGVGGALRAAAAAPPRPVRSNPAAVHMDSFAAAAGRPPIDDVLVRPAPDARRLRTAAARLATALDRRGLDNDTVQFIDRRLSTVVDRLGAGQAVPILPLLGLVDAPTRPGRERLRDLAAALDVEPDSEDLAALGAMVARRPAQPVSTAFDIDRAGAEISAAFDPTTTRPAIVDRVLGGVLDTAGVVEADPIAPVELTPDLDLAAWQFLRDDEPEWLLPGGGSVPEDSVVGLTTNPGFVDAFMVGLNAQVVGELRFRNYPLIPGWTPVRTFWDRVNLATGAGDDDIVDIATWPADSPFGDASHQTPSASSADLVILFATPLFREYPGTLVYLVPAPRKTDGTPDWATDPDFGSRQFPTFQGRISSDLVFFGFDLDPALGAQRWVVLEETVTGRRFFNAGTRPSAATNGADLAAQTVSAPRRVLLRGDRLLPRPAP
jgi:hypothetical protein